MHPLVSSPVRSLITLLAGCGPVLELSSDSGSFDTGPAGEIEVDLGWRSILVADGSERDSGFPVTFGLALLEGQPDVVTVFGLQREAPAGSTETPVAVHWICNDDACSDPVRSSSTVVGEPVARGGSALSSVAVARGPTGAPIVHIVRREKVEVDCDGDGISYLDAGASLEEADNLDLVEWEWDTLTGASTRRIIDINRETCGDRDLSLVTWTDEALWTCFTYKGEGPDEVQCTTRTGDTWDTAVPLDNADGIEDHAAYVLRDGHPFVATHRVQADGVHAISLGDLGSPSRVEHEATVVGANHPALAVGSDGRLRAVWSDSQGLGSTIRYTTCPGDRGCGEPGDWTSDAAGDASVVWEGLDVQHAQIAVDGDLEIVAFEEDMRKKPGDPPELRVRVTERCGDGPWSEPELIRTPDAPREQQLLFPGRPALAIDTAQNTVHLALVEINDRIPVASDGEAWWLRRVYRDCP